MEEKPGSWITLSGVRRFLDWASTDSPHHTSCCGGCTGRQNAALGDGTFPWSDFEKLTMGTFSTRALQKKNKMG
jgi:hypothetical protein